MKAQKNFIAVAACVVALVVGLSATAFADTIRLKDGSIIKGKVVDFKGQQFTVILNGSNSRRSQLTLFIEDVESIEFDSAAAPAVTNTTAVAAPPVVTPAPRVEIAPVRNDSQIVVGNPNGNSSATNNQPRPAPSPVNSPRPNNPNQGGGVSAVINSQPTALPNNNPRPANSRFIPVAVKVLADNTANGWTNTGLVVKKGQRLRISANGRISLGSGKYATPAGMGSIADGERLMKTEPTGALIAVIGDDNNEFIFVGANREFEATRDGTLFLGVNEGNLEDNSGAFDATVEAEAIDATAQK